MSNIRLVIAIVTVLSPLWLVWKIAGKEGLIVFLAIVGSFIGICLFYLLAHWAIETILVTIGFDKKSINRDRCRSTFIVWRS